MLDKAIGDWTATVDLDQALALLEKAEVPSGRIYSIADIATDLQYQARGMIERHRLGDRELLLPGIVPRLSDTPGETRWIGPKLGEHTDSVLGSAGYDEADIRRLREANIIA
jgi:formyl-CoA transferase